MDGKRKEQILTLLSEPVFNITISDEAHLHFYDQALTHSSYAKEQKDRNLPCEDNERMEFFGDCILDFLVSRELYESFPERLEELRSRYPKKTDEALLTDMLHSITNTIELSKTVLKLGIFEKAILCGNKQTANDKIRADAFEAFIAAIFYDQGIERTRAIVSGLFKEKIIFAEPIISWINELQEFILRLEKTADVKNIIKYEDHPDTSTPAHDAWHISDVYVKISGNEWELWGSGRGKKESDAHMAAAEDAFRKHCLKQESSR
jgi:ribonuclease III